MDYYPTNDDPRHKDPPHVLLHRRYIAEILCKIRKEFHWAYSLLRALPAEQFCIRRVYDFTKDWQASSNYNVPKTYSADEFLRDLRTYTRMTCSKWCWAGVPAHGKRSLR